MADVYFRMTSPRQPKAAAALDTTAALAVFAGSALGLSKVAEMDLQAVLISQPTVHAWQALSTLAMLVNLGSVSMPGRLDGEVAARNRAEMDDAAAKDDVPLPRMSARSLFTPRGWAFAIWGPIFLLETTWHLAGSYGFTWVHSGTGLDGAVLEAFASGSVWWAAACVAQAMWCATFRRSFLEAGPAFLMVPTLFLAADAFCLSQWHLQIRRAQLCHEPTTFSQIWLLRLAVTSAAMHFAWLCCATLVGLNGVVAESSLSRPTVSAVAALSALVGAGATTVWTLERQAPALTAVCTWALLAMTADLKLRKLGHKPGYSTTGLPGVLLVVRISAMCAAAVTGLSLAWLRTGTEPDLRFAISCA